MADRRLFRRPSFRVKRKSESSIDPDVADASDTGSEHSWISIPKRRRIRKSKSVSAVTMDAASGAAGSKAKKRWNLLRHGTLGGLTLRHGKKKQEKADGSVADLDMPKTAPVASESKLDESKAAQPAVSSTKETLSAADIAAQASAAIAAATASEEAPSAPSAPSSEPKAAAAAAAAASPAGGSAPQQAPPPATEPAPAASAPAPGAEDTAAAEPAAAVPEPETPSPAAKAEAGVTAAVPKMSALKRMGNSLKKKKKAAEPAEPATPQAVAKSGPESDAEAPKKMSALKRMGSSLKKKASSIMSPKAGAPDASSEASDGAEESAQQAGATSFESPESLQSPWDEATSLIKSMKVKASGADAFDQSKAAKHMPLLTLQGGVVTAQVPHEMSKDHQINLLWIQDAYAKCLVAKRFTGEEEASKLSISVANLVAAANAAEMKITAYARCNKHGFWQSRPLAITGVDIAHKGKARSKTLFLLALPVIFIFGLLLLTDIRMLLPLRPSQTDAWNVIENRGGVVTSSRTVEGSPLLGFRGEAHARNVPIGKVMKVFLDTELAPTWVKDLSAVEWTALQGKNRNLCPGGHTCDLYFQHYNMPWPVGDREFVLRRAIKVDKRGKAVSASYASVEDDRYPEKDSVVRAESTETSWSFTSDGDGGTHVVIEAVVDPKGTLPANVVNLLQRRWPKSTIRSLLAAAKKADEHVDFAQW